MTNIRIGKEVWYKATWTDVNSGIVTEICDGKEKGYVIVKGTNNTCDINRIKIENCYPTEKDLLEALKAEWDKKINEYCKSIRTVEDLVRFCYSHSFNAKEHTDWKAKKAAELRAKELLNIDLST